MRLCCFREYFEQIITQTSRNLKRLCSDNGTVEINEYISEPVGTLSIDSG